MNSADGESMVEITKKQAEYVEYIRKAIFDPEIKELAENQELLNHALLIGYVIKEELT